MLKYKPQVYTVNELQRQILLLVSIMVFLSAITIFLIQASNPEEPSIQEEGEKNNTLTDQVRDIEVTEPEGDNLLSQSVRGLIALYRDFQSGTKLFLDLDETNETTE